MQRSLFPLRTTLDTPVRIKSARLQAKSSELNAAGWSIDVLRREKASDVTAAEFDRFLPRRIAPAPGERYEPMAGTAAYTSLPVLPFGNWEIVSIMGIASAVTNVSSRAFWADIELVLEEETTIGGIAFAGYPFLPSLVRNGEVTANFGLPREIRLSWPSPNGFLDADDAVTMQQFSAHSGVHALPTGPVRTSRVVLHLGDFPRLIAGIKNDAYSELVGLVIPWLTVCRYREQVRYKPQAPVAVLAATVQPETGMRDHGMPAKPGTGAQWHADGVYLAEAPELRFMTLSAASMTAPGRTYSASASFGPFEECFCSPVLEPNETLRIYLEQPGENPRTLAGLRLLFRELTLKRILKNPQLEIEIAEVDPPSGTSPLSLDVARDARYFAPIFDGTATAADLKFTCRFIRPTTARFLLLVLHNRSKRRAQIAIRAIEALQSAHVVITPRPTRTQLVKTMHYRILGANLGSDYSRIGTDGFGFAVEHLLAGEPHAVLFSAATLTDLLQHGSARLYANHRYLETAVDVIEERATVLDDSFETHESSAWSKGWRRNESGDGVRWDRSGLRDGYNPDDGLGFSTLGNAEVRTQLVTLPHEGLGVFFDELRGIFNVLAADNPLFKDPNFWPDPSRGARLLRQDPDRPYGLSWEDTMWRGMPGVGRVGLLNHLTLPPYLMAPENLARFARTFAQKVTEWARNPMAFPDGPPLDDLFAALYSALSLGPPGAPNPFAPAVTQLLNGLSIGVGGGVSYIGGVSASASGSPWLPGLSHSATSGTTGTIAKQATLAGYSYGQVLSKGHEATAARVNHTDGLMHSTVTRNLNLPGTQRNRTAGVEVAWQGRYIDVITGSLPLNVKLAGTAGLYRTTDEALRVRFNGAMSDEITMDVWFDIEEEMVRDDY